MTQHVDIAIVGAGFGGLGAAIRLSKAGFGDLLVFDDGDDVGGTWRDNTYPGCACDVPSHLYSFSFAPNPDWSNTFSGQAEIWAYLRGCVDRFGLRERIRTGHRVTDAAWDGTRWVITTSQGEYTARVLIAAAGPLSDPAIPDIPGIGDFQGTVFHSARWRHDHDLSGKRVAVIGTGASAIQFVPHIQPEVAKLSLFQRTPAWIMPRLTRRISRVERLIYRHVPGAQRLARLGIYSVRDAMGVGFLHPRVNRLASRLSLRTLRRQVRDPQLRDKITPRYAMGCKRVLISNDYWPTLTKPNVDVVTSGIARITAGGLITADGVEHPADTIILGTGFHVTDSPIMRHIRGADGRALSEAWTPSMYAYRGTTVPGFPNLFFLLGPNTGLGHTSVVLMIESQLNLVVKALKHMRARGLAAIEPTPTAQRDWSATIAKKMRGTVWETGCSSWYLDATGRNTTIWPGFATSFRWRTRHFRAADYVAPSAVKEHADAL
ncbi:NAD(P)/FAD-dependent oxidoreductase [Hamadaea sp. NPDC051192]|uniref:flavin-containing monooxygenase n=1 Tax=Hamadaea sp. NPDC051192 TaxID=3154940 RepID=UPI003414139B